MEQEQNHHPKEEHNHMVSSIFPTNAFFGAASEGKIIYFALGLRV
jgi:hypothetical protein